MKFLDWPVAALLFCLTLGKCRLRNRRVLHRRAKHLILLAFVSYEAVRLWWWGGNCGVVSFSKDLCICSSPAAGNKSVV